MFVVLSIILQFNNGESVVQKCTFTCLTNLVFSVSFSFFVHPSEHALTFNYKAQSRLVHTALSRRTHSRTSRKLCISSAKRGNVRPIRVLA